MIEVEIKRKEEISEDAARVVAEAVMEWLGDKRFSLTVPVIGPDAAGLNEASYSELARMFVEDWA